jgi:hypothetical protein
MNEKSEKYLAVQKQLSEQLLTAYNMLNCCPVCQKDLEINPLSGFKACFMHGDFVIKEDKITWRYMKWSL